MISLLTRLVGPQAARPVLWGLVILGAFLALWAIYGAGKRSGTVEANAKVVAAAQKVERAAHKAEQAAVLADMARTANTEAEYQELKEVINAAPNDGTVGPAVSALIDRVRAQRARRAD